MQKTLQPSRFEKIQPTEKSIGYIDASGPAGFFPSANILRVRSVNSLGFTAGVQTHKRVGPATFFATKRIRKDTAD